MCWHGDSNERDVLGACAWGAATRSDGLCTKEITHSLWDDENRCLSWEIGTGLAQQPLPRGPRKASREGETHQSRPGSRQGPVTWWKEPVTDGSLNHETLTVSEHCPAGCRLCARVSIVQGTLWKVLRGKTEVAVSYTLISHLGSMLWMAEQHTVKVAYCFPV